MSPLTVALFSQYSIVSPAMNVIAAPCFMVLCVGGLSIVILAVFFPSPGEFLLEILREVSEVFCTFVKFVSGLPYIAVPAYCDFILALCLSFALLLFIWGVWPKPTGLKLGFLGAGGLAVAAYIIIILPFTYSDEVIMLDVGQGDAFLVRSQGSVVLIDTGNDNAALLRALGRHRVYRLDAVIISHADDDHCGSLSSLSSFVQIDNVCIAKGALECECSSCVNLTEVAKNLVDEKGIKALSVDDRLRVGAFEVEVIWPDAFNEEGGNADSLSFLMTKDRSVSREDAENTRGQTMLFCGDAEAEELRAMVEKNRLGIVDIYKVGHHGSKNALTEKLAETLSPRLALVSVGENNRYGHPAEETLSFLERVGSAILRTDEEGDVVCKFEDERLAVSSLG